MIIKKYIIPKFVLNFFRKLFNCGPKVVIHEVSVRNIYFRKLIYVKNESSLEDGLLLFCNYDFNINDILLIQKQNFTWNIICKL